MNRAERKLGGNVFQDPLGRSPGHSVDSIPNRRAICSPPVFLAKGALWRFPIVRASNEGSPRPRVARAQGIARPLFSFFPTHMRSGQIVLQCAHRATVRHLNGSSKLACVLSLRMAPMLVYVRPSNEHILIVRVPGAQDQRGRPSHLDSNTTRN